MKTTLTINLKWCLLLWGLLLANSNPLFSQVYSLDVGVQQFIPVPDVSYGVVDHAIWACDNENIRFVQKDNSGAVVEILSYFEKDATIELHYVVKYLDYKGWTRQYSSYQYYTIHCKGSAPTLIPNGLEMKVGETYQLQVSPSSYTNKTSWSLAIGFDLAVTVSDDGLVTAKHTGTGIVCGTVSGYANNPLTCYIIVKDQKLKLNANKKSGTVLKGTEVTLKASQSTATIYYTTDGSSPDYNGDIYTGPITIDKDMTIKAIAYDDNYEPSDILSLQYTVNYVDESELENVIYLNKIKAFSGSELILPLNMKNTVPIHGFKFNLILPSGVTVEKNEKGKMLFSLCSERLSEDDEHILSITEQNDGSLLVQCESQYEEYFSGNDGEIINIKLLIENTKKKGDYPITIKDIELAASGDVVFKTSNFSSTLTVLEYLLGDANGDQSINVNDYLSIANCIHGDISEDFVERNADVDANGIIDVSDYIGVANLIQFGSIYGKALHATIITNNASNVEDTSAKLNGTLSVVSATQPFSIGFFVSTNESPSSTNYIKSIECGKNKTGDFSSTLTDLSYSTTYYYCSYILYEGVYYYGETKSFTTTKKTTYLVGDLYPDNVNPIGVVFSISNGGKSGKIASLEHSYTDWFGAKSWASNYGSGWKLPTKSELQTIASNYDKLSDYIDSGFYWSSTVYSSGVLQTLAYVVTLATNIGYMGYENKYTFYVSDSNKESVLAVKSF